MIIDVVYKGPGVSLNMWYESRHWQKRHRKKKEMAEKLANLFLEKGLHLHNKFDKIGVELFYNSNMDVDNATAMVKIAVDVIKKKFLKKAEDTPDIFCNLKVAPDKSLGHNEYKYRLRTDEHAETNTIGHHSSPDQGEAK